MPRVQVLSLMMAAAFSAALSQDHGPLASPASGPKSVLHVTSSPSEVKSVVITPQGVVETASIQVNGPTAVIIQMREAPLLFRKQAVTALGTQERASQLRQHHSRLKQVQAQLKDWVRTQEFGKSEKDFKEYRFAFNGVATKVPAETLKKLKQHPDVLKVFRDERVKTTLADSVPLIGAPQIWNNYAADGQGIRVAVIDTGIDYTHPDLGGGFGPGFKVMGGYDFVNGDADPKDDNGHGTHVAGIVAANGAVKGVAPGARLMAFKVLDAGGSGFASDIIAGIDRAVDPDQDPATNDGTHIINLSLGGAGDPDDALSRAVDAAVNAGVVCVVAAGNNGSGYSTIGSPGCARRALTVGATDNLDQIANFSSRGPGQPDLAIKPDLTAPGVSVRSSMPGGGYQSLSGTSMATPHVAGATALLLQLHPTWTPEVVKAVLSERAKDLGLDPFVQGGGRLRVVESHLAKAAVFPTNLNFGAVDPDQGIWTKTLPVRLQNLSATSRAYTLMMQGATPPGTTWSITPSNVVLGAGQSQDVNITLTVDNSLLPYGVSPTLSFSGKLIAAAPDDEMRIPVVFYKGIPLTLTFDQQPFYVAIFDQNNDPNDGYDRRLYDQVDKNLSLLLPPRKYDIISYYLSGPNDAIGGRSCIIKEGIDVLKTRGMNFNLNQEVMHKVSLQPRDLSGNQIPAATIYSTPSLFDICKHISDFAVSTFGPAPLSDYYISSTSSAYVFDFLQTGWTRSNTLSRYHEFRYSLRDGIAQDRSINSSPARLVKLNYNVDPFMNSLSVNFYCYNHHSGMSFGLSPMWSDVGEGFPQVLSPPFQMEAHLSSMPYPGFAFDQSSPWVGPYAGTPFGSMPLIQGALIEVPDVTTLNAHLLMQPDTPYYSTRSDRLVVGESPHVWTGRVMFLNTGTAYVYSAYGAGLPLLLSAVGDAPNEDLAYELKQNSVLVHSGLIHGHYGTPPFEISLAFNPGAYQLKVPYRYFVNGVQGQATASMSFDSLKPDPEPPHLKRLRIMKNDEASSLTQEGGLNQFDFQVEDNVGLSQVQAFYQTSGSWQPLPLPPVSGLKAEARVSLPSNLPEGPVNLKFLAVDTYGNTLAQELVPAFYHFSSISSISPRITTQPQSISVAVGQTATFNVSATGAEPLTYQWRRNSTPISGATSSSYTTALVTAGDQGAVFSVVVTNARGSVTSNNAILTVLLPPSVEIQPQSVSVAVGQTATFNISATGTEPLTYQWRRNGTPISGATSSSYTTAPVTAGDQGAVFSVVVMNARGSVTSNNAVLTVLFPTVEILPAALGCFPGDALAFTAKVTNATDDRVIWSASAGSMDDSGHFTAPEVPGLVTITAASREDPSRKATATVTIRGTDFDGSTASHPKLLGLAHAMGSTSAADLAKYDFNGDGLIDDADLAKLFLKMGW